MQSRELKVTSACIVRTHTVKHPAETFAAIDRDPGGPADQEIKVRKVN